MEQKYTGYIRSIIARHLSIMLLITALNTAYAEPPAELIEFWDDFEEESGIQVKHAPWQEILDAYLNDQHPSGISRFDYDGVSDSDLEKLREYLSYLQRLDPRQFNKAEAKAYWINLYNAAVVELLVDASKSDTVNSIRELRSGVFAAGPWRRKIFNVTLQDMTLDDIQHGVIRPIWRDHRTHYVLTKGSLGGANMPKTAFNKDNTEALLAAAEEEYLSHPRAVRLNAGDLILSSVFEWYAADFAADNALFLEYLRNNAPANVASPLNAIDETRFEYDWDLNKPDDG